MDPYRKWQAKFTQYTIIHHQKNCLISKSTPKISLYGEIGELPINFIIDKKQITYLRKLLTSKTQVNDITKIELEDPNKNNIITYIHSLLTKYSINLSVEQIAFYTKNKWNKLITNKINENANIMYLNETNKLRWWN